MNAAVQAVRYGEMGYLKASKQFDVPKRTLERYVKSEENSSLTKLHMGRKTSLPEIIENELVQYCTELDQKYYSLRMRDIRLLAFQLAIKNNLKHSFSKS